MKHIRDDIFIAIKILMRKCSTHVVLEARFGENGSKLFVQLQK